MIEIDGTFGSEGNLTHQAFYVFSYFIFFYFWRIGFGCNLVHPWDSKSILWTQTLQLIGTLTGDPTFSETLNILITTLMKMTEAELCPDLQENQDIPVKCNTTGMCESTGHAPYGQGTSEHACILKSG